jgi:hypothetical protein
MKRLPRASKRLSRPQWWIALAATAGAAIASAPSADGAVDQRVGSYVVHWPDRAALAKLAPQDVVRFSLTHRGHNAAAVVSLVRVARSGAVIKRVSTRRFRSSGTFAAKLPAAAGHFRLVVVTEGRQTSRSFTVATPSQTPAPTTTPTPATAPPCSDKSAVQATLGTDVATAHAGQSISVTLTDTGTACLQASYGITWETLAGGSWIEIPLNRQWPGATRFVYPGAPFVEQFKIPDDATPGTYRLGKNADTGATPTKVTAELTIN